MWSKFWPKCCPFRGREKSVEKAASRVPAYARVRRFLFFAFTSSPVCRNLLCHSSIGVKVFRIEVHSRGEDKKEGRCSPQNACQSGEKVGPVKGEEEKRKLVEARVSRACARDVASPSPQWAIRDTETEQKTRDESSNSSRVFVEKRRVFLPLREGCRRFGLHTGSPSGEYS